MNTTPEPRIPRDNIVSAIQGLLRQTDLVFVHGEPGIGVSAILDQLATAECPVVSLFLTTGARMGYDPSLVLLKICTQLASILGQNEDAIQVENAPAMLRNQFHKLSRKSQHAPAVTFIVDGLHQIPSADDSSRSLILDMLPIGSPGFKFVISGEPSTLPSLSTRAAHKSQGVVGFTLDEAKTFLSDYPQLEGKTLFEIWKNCSCNPSVLSSVRRLLEDGVSPGELRSALESRPPQLFDFEWARCALGQLATEVLSVVTVDDVDRTVPELAAIVNAETTLVEEATKSLRFLKTLHDGKIQFVSPLFAEFARKKLTKGRSRALDQLIAYHFASPDRDAAVSELPAYLVSQGRYDDLLRYLSPARFAAAVQLLGSAATVHQRASSAINAARKLSKYDELVRFTLHASSIANLYATQPTDSEVKALLALRKYERALSLAESATMSEDRLQLLALVARHMREGGLTLDEHTIKLVTDLYARTDTSLFSDRATDLAENLLFIRPELGLDLLDKIAKGQDQSRAAWLYAGISIEATRRSRKGSLSGDTVISLRERIGDPEASIVAACAATSYAEYSGPQLMREALGLSRSSDSVRLIADWITANSAHRDALWVVERCLEFAVKSTDYVPDARALRRLAKGLADADEHAEALSRLVAAFDVMTLSLRRSGPSEEYVRLELHLAQAEWKYSRIDAAARIDKLVMFVNDLQDPATRAACYARIHASLRLVDPLKTQESSYALVEDELARSIDDAMSSTAEPHRVLEPALRALAPSTVDIAIDTAMRFTSARRRDNGLMTVLFVLLRENDVRIDQVVELTNRVEDASVRDLCTIFALADMSAAKVVSSAQLASAKALAEASPSLSLPHRCDSICFALVAAKKHAFPDEMQKSLCKELDAAWNSLEWDWRRVEVGFRIAAALAEEYPEIGATYFEEASKVRNGVVFDTKKRATTFLLCTKIALRSFGYLLKRNRESVQNLSDMQSLIASVSSRLDRLRLWTELSLRYYSADRLDDCSRVCRDEVRPLLEDIRPLGHSDFGRALAEAAPALFCCQPETAIEQIKLLRQPLRDSALDSIARYILQRIPPDDAFSAPLDKAYDVDFDDVQKLFRVIGEIENDALSYRLILAIGCTVAHKKRETFSREQKRLVRERILHLSREKFPARGCIEHEGYAIAAEAQAHRIDGTGADWESLAERARCLPNSSDCVYVLLAIASCMPSSVTRVRQTIFDEAEKKANLLVSAHDRFTRLVELADALTVHDNANARRVVTMAGKVWSASEKGVDSTPRHLIDLAHRLDPELAAALAKELDDDPARAQVSRELRSQLEVKSLLGTLGEDELLPLHHREHLPQVAWTALGEINAGTRLPLQADAIWNLLQTAGELPLQLAYPVVSLAICSAGLRFAGTNQSSDILRSIFAGANIAASVTKDLVTRSPHRIQASEVEKPASGVLIANGEKNKAMIWLEQWCSVNVGDSIVICDGYFGLEDLSVVKLLASIARTSRFESSRRRKR